MKKKAILFIAALIVGIGLAAAQTARVQVIHNSADLAAGTVDVYINETLWIDNFTFRTATPFLEVTAEIPLTIGFAPGNSVSVNDTIASFSWRAATDEMYVIVANGIVSDSGYAPAPPLTLFARENAREKSLMPGFTDILFMHGSTDAPALDIEVEGIISVVDDISYGEFNGYMEAPAINYTVVVTDSANTMSVGTYQAPLASLGLEGQAIVVVASGFMDPELNSEGPEFGLWLATPMGGPMMQLTDVTAITTIKQTEDGLELWPNPVFDVLNLTYAIFENTSITIEVMNLTGQVVKKFEYTDIQKGIFGKEIDMSDLNAGIYFINLKTADKVISHKINKK